MKTFMIYENKTNLHSLRGVPAKHVLGVCFGYFQDFDDLQAMEIIYIWKERKTSRH